jgi:hypothetical protein
MPPGSPHETREVDATVVARKVLPLATLLIIMCFLAVTGADADLWGHLIFGRDIVSSGTIHQRDVYSFTSDLPWVNHEWLAEVIMWIAYAVGGSAGLVALKLLIVCVSGALLLKTWRPLRMNPMWRDGLLLITALGSWPLLITFRPQVFSFLLFSILLFALVRVQAGRLRWLALVPVCFAIWVNVHGGWLVGATALTMFVATFSFEAHLRSRDRAILIATLALVGVATLCNPYGTRMLTFLWDTVGPNRADISEWQPVTRLPLVALALWLLPTSIVVTALWYRSRSIPLSSLAIIALLGVSSLRVIRLVGFYSLASAFLLVPFVPISPVVQAHRVESTKRLLSTLVAFTIVGAAVMAFGRQINMNAEYLPEPEASAYVSTNRLAGNMFTWFDYGEYAIWHFWPAIHVSMDGRRETVYSQRIRDVHFAIYRNAPGAVDALTNLHPDYVWLPVSAPVVPALEAAGWQLGFRGPRSVILYRNDLPRLHTTVVDSSPREPRSFPGP